ncbi:MAG: SLBB domain-containing protein [Longimicrobiales bacterium]
MSRLTAYRAALALVVGITAGAGSASAQIPQDTAELRRRASQQLGQDVSQAQIIERLRQSGMTRSQVRSRLQQLGYDPGLADPYFDALERGGEPPRGTVSSEFLGVLEQIGITTTGLPGARFPLDSVQLDSLLVDTLAVDSLAPGELPIFGRSLFRRFSTEFEPVMVGPVGPNYQLGPGDEVVLILTGDVELAYTLTVTREGSIVIPDVGQVFVNGLTLAQLEDRLYQRLGQVYSGVRRGPEATTHFQASLGRLRANEVFVHGEVERPGAYQLSAVATAFTALYRARGPNESGSFRHIEVHRDGQVVAAIDLYDYLVRGDSRSDIRLEHGDRVFVPLAGPRVAAQGAVRRAAIYELKGDEGLPDLLRFAGGLQADAVVRRIQIDRVVPPDRRTRGIDRVLVDVPIEQLIADGEPVALFDGDQVHVFPVSEERRHRLVVTGEVRRPGLYEWSAGTTLWDVIDRAEGLDESAYTARAHIFRLDPHDDTRRLIQTPLLTDAAGRPAVDVELADLDSIVVYSRRELRNEQFVNIDGFVKEPGTYTFAEGMSLEDLILAAGGFLHGAYVLEAEVARQPSPLVRSDTTAIVHRVALTDDRAGAGALDDAGNGEVPVWTPDANDFRLRHGDRVYVRKAPGYEELKLVILNGEVGTPGTFVLATREERLTDLLQRAGGPTPEAYLPGLRLFREGRLLATDLERAFRDPDSRFNIVLEAGDSLYVPQYDPRVMVTGAVGFETAVLYEPGRSVSYYVNRAGGFAEAADRGRLSVAHQDGERHAVQSILGLRREPAVRPGSTIFVPAKPEDERGFDWDSFLARLATIATLLIAVERVSN